MAYQNITFPSSKLIHGIRKESLKAVQIVSNGNIEYRILKNSSTRHRWTIPARNMTTSTMSAIVAFSETVNMSLDSFNYVCPYDGTTYKVRFDQAAIDYSAEALDLNNNIVVVNMSDIKLIQVFE